MHKKMSYLLNDLSSPTFYILDKIMNLKYYHVTQKAKNEMLLNKWVLEILGVYQS